jgi:hypothetical protein
LEEIKVNNKEKIEELQKCADRHRAIHDSRLKVEYRILITLIGFYASATWAILREGPFDTPIRWAVSVGYLILASFTAALLYRLHKSNQVNKAVAENYEAEIIELLDLIQHPIPKKFRRTDRGLVPKVKFLISNWGLQALFVFCFAIVGSLLILTK